MNLEDLSLLAFIFILIGGFIFMTYVSSIALINATELNDTAMINTSINMIFAFGIGVILFSIIGFWFIQMDK